MISFAHQKLGKLKLALDDLNRVIAQEPRYFDALWQRHSIFVTLNQLDKALEDLDVILKYQRNHSGASLLRSIYACFELLRSATAIQLLCSFQEVTF